MRISDWSSDVCSSDLLPFAQRRMVGPYIFFDRMGPKQLAPGLPREADVRPHPHIGLSTITYLFDGEITHRDSLGSEQPIRPDRKSAEAGQRVSVRVDLGGRRHHKKQTHQ